MRDVQRAIDANLNEVAEDSIVDKISERFSSSFLRRQGEHRVYTLSLLFEFQVASDRTMVQRKYIFGENSSRLPFFSFCKKASKTISSLHFKVLDEK